MKIVETCTIWVCSCCFMAAVNGEPCQCCCDHEEDGPCNGCERHPDGLMGSISPADNVTPGRDYKAHAEDCLYRLQSDEYQGCDCETINHSLSPCDGCNTALHGKRQAMTLWIGENKA